MIRGPSRRTRASGSNRPPEVQTRRPERWRSPHRARGIWVIHEVGNHLGTIGMPGTHRPVHHKGISSVSPYPRAAACTWPLSWRASSRRRLEQTHVQGRPSPHSAEGRRVTWALLGMPAPGTTVLGAGPCVLRPWPTILVPRTPDSGYGSPRAVRSFPIRLPRGCEPCDRGRDRLLHRERALARPTRPADRRRLPARPS